MDAMRMALPLLAAAAWTIGSTSAVAATNAIDTSFGTGGLRRLDPAPVTGYVFALSRGLTIGSDGGILIGGHVSVAEIPGPGAPLGAIGKLHADGSWDESFADHGVFILPHQSTAAPNGGDVTQILELSDHSIVAAGGAYIDNFGSGAEGFTHAYAASSGTAGQVYVTIGAINGNLEGCVGLVRLAADRLFDAQFDTRAPAPSCAP